MEPSGWPGNIDLIYSSRSVSRVIEPSHGLLISGVDSIVIDMNGICRNIPEALEVQIARMCVVMKNKLKS